MALKTLKITDLELKYYVRKQSAPTFGKEPVF